MKTSDIVVSAVLAHQEAKRLLLVEKQRDLDGARRALGAAQASVDAVRQDLDELQKFLFNSGATSQGKWSADKHLVSAEAATNHVLRGRLLRPAVLECAELAAQETGHFTIDDLMSVISGKGYELSVEYPRSRASQILTMTAGYSYDEERKAWTKQAA